MSPTDNHNEHNQKFGTVNISLYFGRNTISTPKGVITVELNLKRNRIARISIKPDFEFWIPYRIRAFENVLRNVDMEELALREIIEAYYAMHDLSEEMIAVSDWVKAILNTRQSITTE